MCSCGHFMALKLMFICNKTIEVVVYEDRLG